MACKTMVLYRYLKRSLNDLSYYDQIVPRHLYVHFSLAFCYALTQVEISISRWADLRNATTLFGTKLWKL